MQSYASLDNKYILQSFKSHSLIIIEFVMVFDPLLIENQCIDLNMNLLITVVETLYRTKGVYIEWKTDVC